MEALTTHKIETMFQKSFIPFDQLNQISTRDKAYANADPRLRPFYKYDVDFNALQQVIEDKGKDNTDRALLTSVLLKQYKDFDISASTHANIEALSKQNTYTIITAHQPSLFTGPSYFIYKICSILNLAKQLNEADGANHFVPVFIMGGEDHDFEEISSTQVFGKPITWNTNAGGSVGNLSNSTLTDVLDELKALLGDREIAASIYATIETAFTKFKTYGTGMRFLVNELFKDYGLVVVDMSDAELKRAFIPIIEKEIFERKSVDYIQSTVEKLEQAGFSNQAHPRDINFFYLGEGYRERIVFENGKYAVLNKDISFSEEEIKKEINEHPERFSPNVNMRPIYQEFIFPNLAYVGGGGELAYWMERKSQFAYFGLNYPMLIRRNSVLIVDKTTNKKLSKLSLSLHDLLSEEHEVVNTFLNIHSQNELSLEDHKKVIEETFNKIIEKTKQIDASLIGKVEGEKTKQIKALESLEGRLKKAEKNKFNTGISQVKATREKLFPKNGLQERKENFLTFYTRYGKSYFDYLVENLDPFAKGLIVIEESTSKSHETIK